jgi:hypothetical protein
MKGIAVRLTLLSVCLGLGTPSCAPLGTGQVACVVMAPDNKLTSTVGP